MAPSLRALVPANRPPERRQVHYVLAWRYGFCSRANGLSARWPNPVHRVSIGADSCWYTIRTLSYPAGESREPSIPGRAV